MRPRALASVLLSTGGAVAAWGAFVRIQGDSEVVYGSDELSHVGVQNGSLYGEVAIVNVGRQMAAIRRVEGRVVEGPRTRVLVSRQGSRPHERGFWVSNLLKPGESCVVVVEVELDATPETGVVIELDVHEIGRRLLVHRRASFRLSGRAHQSTG